MRISARHSGNFNGMLVGVFVVVLVGLTWSLLRVTAETGSWSVCLDWSWNLCLFLQFRCCRWLHSSDINPNPTSLQEQLPEKPWTLTTDCCKEKSLRIVMCNSRRVLQSPPPVSRKQDYFQIVRMRCTCCKVAISMLCNSWFLREDRFQGVQPRKPPQEEKSFQRNHVLKRRSKLPFATWNAATGPLRARGALCATLRRGPRPHEWGHFGPDHVVTFDLAMWGISAVFHRNALLCVIAMRLRARRPSDEVNQMKSQCSRHSFLESTLSVGGFVLMVAKLYPQNLWM